MTKFKSRPPVIDAHGVEHAASCDMPGWTSQPAIGGWHLHRCRSCGATRLARTGGAR